MDFSDKLKYLMKGLGIRSVELARAMHVDPATVSRWRTGDRSLSPRSEDAAAVAACVSAFMRSGEQDDWLNALLQSYAEPSALPARLLRWLFDGKPPGVGIGDGSGGGGIGFGNGMCFPDAEGFRRALSMFEQAFLKSGSQSKIAVYITEQTSLLRTWEMEKIWERLFAINRGAVQVVLEHAANTPPDAGIATVFLPACRSGKISLSLLPRIDRYFFYNVTIIAKDVGTVVVLETASGKAAVVSMFIETASFVAGTAAVLSELAKSATPATGYPWDTII